MTVHPPQTLEIAGGEHHMADDSSRRGPNPRTPDSGERGYATAGTGTSYAERAPNDAPRYGDRARNTTGATSAARGQAGFERQREPERPARGPHAGRGPRTYRRADATIYEDVCEGLKANPDLDAGDIEVSVEGGEVTLGGTVESRDARWLAEDLAESVPGVREVHNRLRVAHG
jgi:hypothetical protein